jgi:TonB family protein
VHVKDAVKPAENVPPPPTENEAANLAAPRPTSTVKTSTAAGRPAAETANNSAASAGDPKGGLKGLAGLSGLTAAGPQMGPSAGSGANLAQALDSSQVQSTVSRYQSGVKRGCWQPALDSRDKSAPSSARVSVTITVSSSGAVKSVSTSGDPSGYRGLASCIQSRVSTWSFPASSGSTTVNVPFVFAAQ